MLLARMMSLKKMLLSEPEYLAFMGTLTNLCYILLCIDNCHIYNLNILAMCVKQKVFSVTLVALLSTFACFCFSYLTTLLFDLCFDCR